MKITLLLFAQAREMAGTNSIEIVLAPNSCVGQLKAKLVADCPELQSLVTRCMIAVDQAYATDDMVLTSNVEVALIPPVSGG